MKREGSQYDAQFCKFNTEIVMMDGKIEAKQIFKKKSLEGDNSRS